MDYIITKSKKMRPIERIPIYLKLLKDRKELVVNENCITITPGIYNKLKKAWTEAPDLRLTQLCVNEGIINNCPGFWYYEEDFSLMLHNDFPVREILLWGTYGKSGRNKLKYVLLKNMTNEHIQAIIDTQHQLAPKTIQRFIDELKLRKENEHLNIYEK